MRFIQRIKSKIVEHPVLAASVAIGIVSAIVSESYLLRKSETNIGQRPDNCSVVPAEDGEFLLSCSTPPGKLPTGSSSSEVHFRKICIDVGFGKVCTKVPGLGKPLGGENSEIGKAIKNCARLGIIAVDGQCTDYEAAIEGLAEAPLAYNRPVSMTRGVTQEISLVLDLDQQGAPATQLRGLSGEIVQATTKVARHMSAELRGVAFEIDPKEPQRRLVTAAAPVQWTWAVKPIEEGEAQFLTLEVHAHIEAEGAVSQPIKIRTFRDEILVEVTTWDRVTDVAAEIKPIHALVVAVIGSGWGLFVWWRRKKWRVEPDSEEEKESQSGE